MGCFEGVRDQARRVLEDGSTTAAMLDNLADSAV